MSKIENLTAELCDELMVAAARGNILQIRQTVVMLIEFAAVELRKNDELGVASILDRFSKEIEALLDRT